VISKVVDELCCSKICRRASGDPEARLNVPRSDFSCTSSSTATPPSRFLDGASLPEQLALTASQLGYSALALTDHNGLYGSMAFAQESKQLGLQRSPARS